MHKMRFTSTQPIRFVRSHRVRSPNCRRVSCSTLLHLMVFLAATTGIPLWAQTPTFPFEFSAPAAGNQWLLIRGQAVFQGSQLALRGGSTLVWHDFRLTDFAVELQYQVQGPTDVEPGFYVHSQLDPDTHRLQGPKFTFPGARNSRRRLVRNRVQQPDSLLAHTWQHLRLVCVGDRVQMFRNRALAGEFALDRAAGHFALSASGDRCSEVIFKDVVITELSHRSLFNGRDLQGWQGAEGDATACWEVRDGLLSCTGAPGPWLRNDATVGDFNLRLEYKLLEGGNSGVYVRVPADGRHHGAGAGLEVQILDDASDRYRDLKPYQFTGGLYAVVPPRPGTARPAGQWNALEIDCRGKHYRVTHNGIVVVDTTDREYPELTERLVEGYIGLQNHSESVWFRNIRIGPAF